MPKGTKNNSGNKKLNTADLLKNLKQQSSIAFGNIYDVDEDDYDDNLEEENENIIEEENPEKNTQININNNNNINDDEDEDQMEDINDSSFVQDPQEENQLNINNVNNNDNNNDEEVPVDELENNGIELDEDDDFFKGLDESFKKLQESEKKRLEDEKARKEKEKEEEELLGPEQSNPNVDVNQQVDYTKNYDLKSKDLKGTLFDFSDKEDSNNKEDFNKKVDEIFKGIDDNLKNVLGDNIVDLDDIDEKPENDIENMEIGGNIETGDDFLTGENINGKDINSLKIDEPENEPEIKDLRTDFQKAEDKVNSWLNDDEEEPEKDENKLESENNQKTSNKKTEDYVNELGVIEEEPEEPEDELKRKTGELSKKVDELVGESNKKEETGPSKKETSNKTDEIIEKTEEITKKVEMVNQSTSSENEPNKEEIQPEKKEPKPEDLEDNGKVRGSFVPVEGEKMLPKQQLNHLSDMIDDINSAHGTAFSSKGIKKYLNNQFKHGQGESLEEQRNSFKGSYTSFCKEAYQNMLDKRSKMPFDKRPSMEQTLADFQKFTKQLENLSKANGWMHSETEMGPFGGLEPSEIKKMQKAAVDKEPKNTLDAVKNEIAGKPSSKNLKEFSEKFNEQVKNVPQADKESSVQGPEASQTIAKLKALNDVHNNRTRGYRFRHPILYRREGKLLDSAMKTLEEKGYDREVINQMLKEKDIHDPAKEAHEKDVKSINDIEKKTSKQTRDFEERKEREDYLARKNIKGMRKQISVPEADNSRELVDVPKEKKSPAVQKKLEVQKTNNLQVAGSGK